MTTGSRTADRRRRWERRLARLADYLACAKPDQSGGDTIPRQEKKQ